MDLPNRGGVGRFMTKFPMLMALKTIDNVTDADFELGETREELEKRIQIAKQKEQRRKQPDDEAVAEPAAADEEADTSTSVDKEPESGVASGAAVRKLLDEYVGKISAYHALTGIVIALPPIVSGAQIKTSIYDKVEAKGDDAEAAVADGKVEKAPKGSETVRTVH
jgi:hypothetical protein